DASGNPSPVTDALNRVTATVYDGRNQLLSATAADGGVTTYAYAAFGGTTGTTAPPNVSGQRNQTVTTYTPRGLADSVVVGAGTSLAQTTTFHYDAAGDRDGKTTGLGPRGPAGYEKMARTSYVYDDLNRLTDKFEGYESSTSYARYTSYAYDKAGNTTAMTTGMAAGPGTIPKPTTTAYQYDRRD